MKNDNKSRRPKAIFAFCAFGVAGLCAIAALILDIIEHRAAGTVALNAVSATCFAGLTFTQGVKIYKTTR